MAGEVVGRFVFGRRRAGRLVRFARCGRPLQWVGWMEWLVSAHGIGQWEIGYGPQPGFVI
ncbi:hypothetical protein PM082_000704 [Marasmius tenuissimus]|nr:hypothetical protein PM082_000704 [Marasmius tenuissimus]